MEVRAGYKQTEVGVIPEDWEVKELSDLLDQSRGIRYGIVQPGNFDPRGCLMLRSQDYSKGWANPDEMHRVSSRIENQYKNARIRSSDLILTIVGAGTGQVEITPAWLDGAILSRSTARVAIDERQADHRFVGACLQSPLGKRQILNCLKEGAQPVVSCRDVAKFFVPCPPLPEQRVIAAALSDTDTLISSLEKLIAKKRNIKQGTMQQLLIGKKRLPGFSGEWEEKKIGELLGYERPDKYIVQSTKYLANGDVPVLTANKSFVLGFTNESEGIFRNVPVIIFDDFTTDSKYVDFPFKVKSSAIKILKKKNNDVDLRYIFERMQLVKFPIGDHKRYYISQYQHLELKVPKIEEQIAITQVLSDMDAEIEALESKLTKYRMIKQGMMQELLTGKTRLI